MVNRVRPKPNPDPELIKDRDRLYKLAKRSTSDSDWIASRKARNKCNLGVKHAKEEYVKSQLIVHEKDPRKFWAALKLVCSPAETSSSFISLANSSTGTLLEVPEAFNAHLCEVGKRLFKKFRDDNVPFRSVLATSFKFNEISTTEVNTLISKIKTYKSSAITGLTS